MMIFLVYVLNFLPKFLKCVTNTCTIFCLLCYLLYAFYCQYGGSLNFTSLNSAHVHLCVLRPVSFSKLVVADGESKACLNLHQAGFCSRYWVLLCEAQESSADH